MVLRTLTAVVLLALSTSPLFAQRLDSSALKALEWRAIGPAVMGGRIDDVAVDERNPSTIYVGAASGGIWKTTNAGTTWTPIFDREGTASIGDIALGPTNPELVWVGTGEPNNRQSSSFGDGVYKSIDGGRTWAKLAGGLPDGVVGRIGLSVYRRDPRVVYATVEHRGNGGTFRSDDAGATWRRVNALNPRPMYYSKIHVDPTSDRRIYVLGADFFVSDDGGRTFADPVSGTTGANNGMSPAYDVGVHGDHHALWINPANPKHLVLGNDGGLYYSFDGSVTWDKVNNIPLAQFYGIGVDMATPYNVYGGLQDTHSFGGPSATRHVLGILNQDWVQINTGDGMYAQVDPTDPATIYTESQDGNLSRFHRPTGDRKPIRPVAPPGEAPYRFNWTSPIVISPHNPKTLYFGGNRVFTSPDRGDTWTAGPDLTRAENRDTLTIMGAMPGPDMLARNDGVGAWGTITTLAESPRQAGLLWAGTDDGLVQVSRDAGKTWTNVTDRIPGPPKKGRVSRVEPGQDAGTVYVSLDRHQDDDFAPYLFVSKDFGQTWRSLSAGLPPAGWINVVREHPKNANLLFVGTETGLFTSLDGGGTWTRFTHGFPTVPVDDLVIHPRDNDLVVGTHGRAIYVLDDLTPLEEMRPMLVNAMLYVFTPRPATIVQRWKHESYSAQRVFIGPNPPEGVLLTYYLKADDAGGGATVSIRNNRGTVVRRLTGPAAAGFNRVAWDLRSAAPAVLGNARGPYVLPGVYSNTVEAAKMEMKVPLRVEADAAFPVTEAERTARREFLTGAQALLGDIATSANAVRAVRDQVTALQEQLKAHPNVPADVASAAVALLKTLGEAQGRLGGGGGGGGEEGGGGGGGLRGRVANLFGELDGSGIHQGTLSGPTAVQRQRLDTARADVKTALAAVERALGEDLTALNDAIARANLPRIARPR